MGAFLTACLIPSLGMLFHPGQQTAANQVLAPPPALRGEDGALNPDVLQETTDYLADHFAFRQELITANAALTSAVFHTSAEDKVLLGRDGWLFYRETLDDCLRAHPLTDRQLCAAARTLALMQEYAQSRGAQLLFTVAPNKATLYPQYLPRPVQPLSEESDLDRLVPLLEEEGVAYADLFAPFQAESSVLYFRRDSHWNTQGAALAQQVLLQALGKEFTPFRGTECRAAEGHRGDLYEMLYPTGTGLDRDVRFDRPFTFSYARQPRGPDDQRIETSHAAKTGGLLMFRDSFGNSLYPFLAEEYGSALFSRSMPYQLTLLDQCGADTVLVELVERNLDYLSTRAPVFPAPERLFTGGTPPSGEGTVRLTASDVSPLAGFTRLEGLLTGPVDDGSPIYVQLGDRLYEASPVGMDWSEGSPFVLYVPQDGPQRGRVLYLQGGELRALIPEPERLPSTSEASRPSPSPDAVQINYFGRNDVG